MDELELQTKQQLLDRLQHETRALSTPELREVFSKIDRKDFVTPDYKVEAYEDYPLPIGFDQTISQPTTVAFMIELLEVKKGNKILDVGSGSGWTTALLATLTGKDGFVSATERVPELVVFAEGNLKSYDLGNVDMRVAGPILGRPGEHFDRILVSAEATEIPDALFDQLSPDGIMVIPVSGSILQIKKTATGKMQEREFPGFSFVPLIKKPVSNGADVGKPSRD